MKTFLTRILSLFLALTLSVVSLPVTPLYASDENIVSGTVSGPGTGDTSGGGNPPPEGTEGGDGDPTGDTEPLILSSGDFKLEAKDLLIPSRGFPF